jgi:glycosyltransferase involved in cell wall biosynthesis
MLMPPRITIVTPSFNQGDFLEETILSVIGQNYPNLEYIIMDGGSTDNSLDIIQKYEKHISKWESGADKGQADAINKGFQHSTGAILGWLNSDDLYLPNTLSYISNRIGNTQENKILFGNCLLFNREKKYKFISNVELSHRTQDISMVDYIFQPSCFWTKSAWDGVGPLNVDLVYCMDWDWFIRAKKFRVDFDVVNETLSSYRLHPRHKSAIGGKARFNEIAGIYRTYNSEEIAQGYKKIQLDLVPKVFERLMRKVRFPWKKRVMRSLFFQNLTDEQYESIASM